MNTPTTSPLPLPILDTPAPAADDWTPLLTAPFAQAWEASPGADRASALKGRLAERLAASRAAAAPMHTVRRRHAARTALTPGVHEETLYQAPSTAPARAGEPWRARLLQLDAGAQLSPECLGPDLHQRHREWLVLQGDLEMGGEPLRLRDYQVTPAGLPTPALRSQGGALVFLRESAPLPGAAASALTVRDHEAGWPEYAPGIRRRVLWQHGGQAALLYCAAPGAQVPNHTHGHDEECLMVQGELFLDDTLLQPGDYQLAPAGTGHRVTETDTGVVIYAHSDLDLRFVA
jgi:quercetin dioxygenase-like cupin family protein